MVAKREIEERNCEVQILVQRMVGELHADWDLKPRSTRRQLLLAENIGSQHDLPRERYGRASIR